MKTKLIDQYLVVLLPCKKLLKKNKKGEKRAAKPKPKPESCCSNRISNILGTQITIFDWRIEDKVFILNWTGKDFERGFRKLLRPHERALGLT